LIVLHDHPACRVSRLGTGLYVLSLGPWLFAALAFEHADRAPILGIEHSPDQGGLRAAMPACWDRIGFEA
jgi:hypothetical protein